MFCRNYEDSWQQVDAINDNHIPSDPSWTIDSKDSLEHLNHDSDMSDSGLDYSTFLEKSIAKTEREEEEALYRHAANDNKINYIASISSNGVPVIETVIEESVTSFHTNSYEQPYASVKVSANNNHSSNGSLNNNINHSSKKMNTKPAPMSPASSISSYSEHQHVVVLDGKKRQGAAESKKFSKKLSRAPDTPSQSSGSDPSSVANGNIDNDHVNHLASQIKQLEARKSHLGTWEITRVAGESSPSLPSSPGKIEHCLIHNIHISFFV